MAIIFQFQTTANGFTLNGVVYSRQYMITADSSTDSITVLNPSDANAVLFKMAKISEISIDDVVYADFAQFKHVLRYLISISSTEGGSGDTAYYLSKEERFIITSEQEQHPQLFFETLFTPVPDEPVQAFIRGVFISSLDVYVSGKTVTISKQNLPYTPEAGDNLNIIYKYKK